MLANLFGRRDRFTPANLRRLVDVLARTPSATPGNSASLVETFREIAELMIYGDQNDPTFFDVFVEHRVLAHFSRFIKQSGGRRGSGLTLQLLQTLSIMIQNTREETSLFYLFSNDHIPRELIACDFDFDDEEVMAYYISFLKTVSLKLNVRTVQFFFFTVADDRANASSRVESSYSFGGGTDDSADEESSSAAPSDAFPLYERASRFLDHPESMVRAAARTTVLNAAAVPDARVRGYLLSDAAWSRCLPRVVAAAGAATAALSEDALCAPARGPGSAERSNLLAELGDLLAFVDDAMAIQETEIDSSGAASSSGFAARAGRELRVGFVEPTLVRSIAPKPEAPREPIPPSSASTSTTAAPFRSAFGASDAGPPRVSALTATFAASRVS